MQIEWGKLAVLLTAIIGAVACMMTHTITEAAGVGIITGCLGYTFGNGRLAARGGTQAPLVQRRNPLELVDEFRDEA